MRATRILQVAFGAVMALFLVAPVLAILPLAFNEGIFLAYPMSGLSLRWFAELASADVWRRSIVNSLLIGTAAAIAATVLGTLAALGLRDRVLPGAGALRTLFLLPMVVPAVVLGVGMQVLYARLGMGSSHVGVIVAHTVLCVPFVVVTVSASLVGIDRSVERAAASLGAGPATTFRTITLPLAAPGMVSGFVFAFATSLDEVVITLFVAGPNQRTLARQMFSSLRENISPAVAAAAFLLIVGTLCLLGLAALLRLRRERQTLGR